MEGSELELQASPVPLTFEVICSLGTPQQCCRGTLASSIPAHLDAARQASSLLPGPQGAYCPGSYSTWAPQHLTTHVSSFNHCGPAHTCVLLFFCGFGLGFCGTSLMRPARL
jgi:hypothetical protein